MTGMSGAPLPPVSALRELDEATAVQRHKVEATIARWLHGPTAPDYMRGLTRLYGFVAPLERCLADTPHLAAYADLRRFRKHLLIEADLRALGMAASDLNALPQCIAVPLFQSVEAALGWAGVIERSTITHPYIFRQLASQLPGEAAFASAYLKCYGGDETGLWQSFALAIQQCAAERGSVSAIIDATKAGCRTFRRWRDNVEGLGSTSRDESAPPPPLRPLEPD